MTIKKPVYTRTGFFFTLSPAATSLRFSAFSASSFYYMLSRWLRHLPAPVQSAIHGVNLTVLACALFALLDSATKFTGQLLPVLMVLWLRFLAQALVTSA